jgi:DNA polymerase-3 subunit delta
MTPEQFLDRLKKGPAPVYLFVGQEAYQRERCRRALMDAVLSQEDRDSGFVRHDLDQISLAAAIDDARSLSLFATQRVVWLASAEAALPRGDAGDPPAELASYVAEPTPGTVVVLEASRFDFEGDDKSKVERVIAQSLAKQAGLQLGLAELAILLEATAGDVSRIAVEIEKLKLFAGDRKVTADDIGALVPDAQATTIFALVNALGRNDRTKALQILDMLSREGEYMPLALTFLATQFRMALAAREANLKSSSQIIGHFNKLGARIWPERARQIEQTVQAFPKAKLEKAVMKLFEADRSLRDARPDDRIVMEEMILALTS